jgi:hypothetical protein
MKVRELIKGLQRMRPDDEVVVWAQDNGHETYAEITNVKRDKYGSVGINWCEDWMQHPDWHN